MAPFLKSNPQTEMGIRTDQAFKHHGSSLAVHECKCQRAFRCSEEDVGASRTSSSGGEKKEDILPGL